MAFVMFEKATMDQLTTVEQEKFRADTDHYRAPKIDLNTMKVKIQEDGSITLWAPADSARYCYQCLSAFKSGYMMALGFDEDGKRHFLDCDQKDCKQWGGCKDVHKS